MKEKRSLGRGFASLLPEVSQPEERTTSNIVMCDLSKIVPNERQPRKKFDKVALQELSDSIKEKGIIQPIVAKRVSNGYQIIAGGRRFEAAKMAGFDEVPLIVRSSEKSEDLELALIENIQRENLNPMEEALGYQMLIDEFLLSHEEIAKKVGKSRAAITNVLRLLKLPKVIQDALYENKITSAHARTILAIDGEKEQITFLNQIIKSNMSVRKAEEVARKVKKSGKSFKLDSKSKNPFLRSIIEEMQKILGTRIKITQKPTGKGQIQIDFFSTQDLNRLLALIRKG